jgi:hypothetical protein
MKTKIYSIVLSCLLLLFGNSCADLEVVNPNNPDTRRVLATAEDLKGVVAGAFVSLYSIYGDGNNAYYFNTNLEWTADYVTMTNNVRAWWAQFKIEPRVQFNNTLAFTDLDVIGRPYRQLHAAISSANDVINAIENEGKQVGANGSETNMVLAAAYFCKAMSLGYLANSFDRAYVVNPGEDVLAAELTDYKAVLEAALVNFDKTIELSTANTFTLATNFINTPAPYSNVQLARLARTYAANFMVQNARTRAENAQTNWDRVLQYTQDGMTEDYIINLDGANWRNGLQSIAGLNWYWRVDHRIIRLMDPTYPKRFPATANNYPQATSADKRLGLYYFYETGLGFFRSDRGPQLRSHYRFARYDELYAANGIGPAPFLYAYTNDLLRAEALAMTNDLGGAIAILNAGKRKTVGELPDLAAETSQADVLATIFAERDIELQLTDYAIHFKDMRRKDALQTGTILHFPVPANVLAVIGETFYSYGGVNNADGVNTANGSNSWLNP